MSCLLTDPDDYEAVNAKLTFNSTRSRACVTVVIEDDDLLENTEEFQLSLTSDEDQVILDPDSTVVSITDTDGMSAVMYISSLLNPLLNSCTDWIRDDHLQWY